MDRKFEILGKEISVTIVALLVMAGLGSAALLNFYGQITATVTIEQSVLLDGQTHNTIQKDFDGETGALGGQCYSFEHYLENKAGVPAKVEFTTTGEEAGVSASYHRTYETQEVKGNGWTQTEDNNNDCEMPEFDWRTSCQTVSPDTGNITLTGSVNLENFEVSPQEMDVWYRIGLVSDESYNEYVKGNLDDLHNLGVALIVQYNNGYVAGIQLVPTMPFLGSQSVGNSFDYTIEYDVTDETSGRVRYRINGGSWNGWFDYSEDDIETHGSVPNDCCEDSDCVFYKYCIDDDLTDAYILSEIFECGTTENTFKATYDSVKATGSSEEILYGEEFIDLTLDVAERIDFSTRYAFDVDIEPDSYTITTEVIPVTE